MNNPRRAPFKATSAAEALDEIRTGSGHLLLAVHKRLNDTRDKLSEGDFIGAVESVAEAHAKLAQLAQAQTGMGLLAENSLVKVGDIEEGMIVPGVGPITNIGPCPGCGDEDCNNVTVTVAGTDVVLNREVEMVVEVPAPE